VISSIPVHPKETAADAYSQLNCQTRNDVTVPKLNQPHT
jgi:hypothetical protein